VDDADTADAGAETDDPAWPGIEQLRHAIPPRLNLGEPGVSARAKACSFARKDESSW
jgi:hypothetical protein